MREEDPSTERKEALVDGRPPLVYTSCRLTVLGGPDAGRALETERDLVRIGTAPDNELVLRDPAVSRSHLELRRQRGAYTVVDLGSRNGTFIGALQLKEGTLRKAAELSLGDSVLRVEPLSHEVAFEASRARRCGALVGESVAMREVFHLLERIAPTELAVLITGETGTGKDAVARELHARSRRKDGPFVALALGALPPALLESAIFGHEAGALEGADAPYPGALERARGGTLYLEELGTLPLELQPRLLRAIERQEIERRAGHAPVRVDVRLVVAATDELRDAVKAGPLHDELYYRLAELRLDLLPLRERPEDVAPLAAEFFRREAAALAATGSRGRRLGAGALAALTRYAFPGNVRELMSLLQRGAALAAGEELTVAELPAEVAGARPRPVGAAGAALPDASMRFHEAKAQVLEVFERQYLIDLLQRHRLHITRAAKEAGIDRRHLYRLLDKYQIEVKERTLDLEE